MRWTTSFVRHWVGFVTLAVAALVVAMIAAGCSTRQRASRGRGDPTDVPDTTPATDGAVTTDAGPRAPSSPSDAGAPPPRDAGRDAGPAPAIDAASPPRACDAPIAPFPADLLPRCVEETRSCVFACGDDAACMFACVRDDPTAPAVDGARTLGCEACMAHQQKRCIDASGCHAETAALACCIESACPDGSCLETACGAEHTAWQTCATTTAVACTGPPTTGAYGRCYGDGV